MLCTSQATSAPLGEPAQLAASGGLTPAPSSNSRDLSRSDSEQGGACHGMVFSMDFQETKKETKSKRGKKTRERGEMNKTKQ